MTVRETLENNIVYVVLVVGVLAFSAGVGAYKAILEIAQLESVSKKELEDLRRPTTTARAPSARSLGCVTQDAVELRRTSARLNGAPSGPRTKEWFDFGIAEGQLTFSVAALDGVGRVCLLEPNTKYYFRYRTQYEFGPTPAESLPCIGEIRSFTSPDT